MCVSRFRREGLKRVYRVLFDALEEWTTLMAHDILVNSHFTAGVFKSTFRSPVPARLCPVTIVPCSPDASPEQLLARRGPLHNPIAQRARRARTDRAARKNCRAQDLNARLARAERAARTS